MNKKENNERLLDRVVPRADRPNARSLRSCSSRRSARRGCPTCGNVWKEGFLHLHYDWCRARNDQALPQGGAKKGNDEH